MSERTRMQRKREKAALLPSVQSDVSRDEVCSPKQDGDEVPSIVHEVLSSNGQSLDAETRSFMEPRFGHDFSKIRVHTDERAAESAQTVHALAYTIGNDIVFREGQYSPGTIAGKQLLAHELTHSIQQDVVSSEKSNGVSFHTSINDTRDAAEQEAYLAPLQMQATGRMDVQRSVYHPKLYRTVEGETATQQGYTFTISLPSQPEASYNNISAEEATRVLRDLCERLSNSIDLSAGMLDELTKNRNDHPIIGFIADTFSGANLPEKTIFDLPRILLGNARTSLDAEDVNRALTYLQQAAQEWQKSERQVYDYQQGTISGAETTVTILQVVEVAGAMSATVATGGIAAEAGFTTLGTATATGLVGGAYGGTQEAAAQGSAIYYGLRDHWDIEDIVRRGLTDTVANFIGGYIGGKLTEAITERFGAYIGEEMTDAALQELGLTREAFLTNSQKFIAEFFGSRGGDLLSSVINVISDKYIHEEKTPSLEDFAEDIVTELRNESAFDIFKGVMEEVLPK